MRGFALLCVVLLVGCPKPEKPSAEATFWTWFAKEEGRLAREARSQDPRGAMMEISGHLSAVSPAVIAELAVENDEMHPHSLVITANGDTTQFETVKKIAAAAPALKGWKVVAFRQRRDPGESIQLEGFEAKQASFFFRELGRANKKIDIEILVSGVDDGNDKRVQQAAFLMLDHMLGEYDVETKIGSIAILPLVGKPGADVKPLSQLAGVVDAM